MASYCPPGENLGSYQASVFHKAGTLRSTRPVLTSWGTVSDAISVALET
ncbi:hypothetical protein E2C01_088521 [Portunus trituberculatus]|uniref:Uncharacterized protein n=1 Tax=Portunus trituberculatus TaxID=210409 RepID=A0A5B7JFM7_PORTR|nr:hypothetical protein [Portunus trituberculatus]